MIVLNFSHPLTGGMQQQLERLAGQSITQIINVLSQIDQNQPLLPQVRAIVDQAGLSADEWQTRPFLINPPALNSIAVVLLAEVHGRCGYFPTMLRIRPVAHSATPAYELGELLHLQEVRDSARMRR